MHSRIDWWSSKLYREAGAWVGPAVGRWAAKILRDLSDAHDSHRPDHSIRLLDLQVPPKYRARALRLLTRFDLVKIQQGKTEIVALNTVALARSKNATQARRGFLPLAERRRIKMCDRFICGSCGKRFSEENLEVDHIVPLSFFGADKLGNLVSLCRTHNRAKLDTFHRSSLRYYRGRRVVRSVGVRYESGFFWPVINGRVCREGKRGCQTRR